MLQERKHELQRVPGAAAVQRHLAQRAHAAQELQARHQAALQEAERAAAAQLATARLQAYAFQARAHAETTALAAEVRGASVLLHAQACHENLSLMTASPCLSRECSTNTNRRLNCSDEVVWRTVSLRVGLGCSPKFTVDPVTDVRSMNSFSVTYQEETGGLLSRR